MKRKERTWQVDVAGERLFVLAKTAGCAARRAFREAIKRAFIDNTPPTSPDGGWKGVAIECIPVAE